MGDEGGPGKETMLRPDVAIWGEEGRRIILTELTVPLEDGCGEASERKQPNTRTMSSNAGTKGVRPVSN